METNTPYFDFSRPLILGSSSPRRELLLRQAGYEFQVDPPHESAECGVCSGETPPELVARLAYQKAADVAQKYDSGLILGCDTVAEIHGQVLGKPIDRNDAERMLRLMSGKEHRVFSGLCLWPKPEDQPLVRVETTHLRMDTLDNSLLEQYLDTNDWEGKAGAFGFQDGLDWVQIVRGSESNVVGLPLELLGALLTESDNTWSKNDR